LAGTNFLYLCQGKCKLDQFVRLANEEVLTWFLAKKSVMGYVEDEKGE
jgi:hypothetical protein